MIDVAALRADTPGSEAVAHLNNAGSSLPPRPVVDATVDYLRLEERMGGYEAADHAAPQLDRVYGAAAALLGCSSGEIGFTASAADSWWRAFSSVRLEPGDRVLVAAIDRVVVHDEGSTKSGIVTFTVDGHQPNDVMRRLRAAGVNVSAPGKRNAQLDLGERGLDSVVRAGVHYFNTDEETGRLLEVVAAL